MLTDQKLRENRNSAEIYYQYQGQTIHSFTIITTQANEKVSKLHDRMPAILLPMEVDEWLDPSH